MTTNSYHLLILPIIIALVGVGLASTKGTAARAAAAPADEHEVPPDYVTLFPSWQRAFIHEGRLVHAAGEDGIMLALFSTAMDRPRGADSRVLLPFTHLDSNSRIPGRPGPSPANSIDPALPPLLHCWDVNHGQFMLLFGRMRPLHDFQLRIYALDSIGGPVEEVPGAGAIFSRQERLGADINLAQQIPAIGWVQDDFQRTTMAPFLAPNPTVHFSLRLLPEQQYELMFSLPGSRVKYVLGHPAIMSEEDRVMFLPAYRPEPYIHLVLGGQYFFVRRSGPLEGIPEAFLKPNRLAEIEAEFAKWRWDFVEENFIFDEADLAAGRVGDPLERVADFSRIREWVASDPLTHFMVQDRDRDMVRFFWGVSGYAELEVMGDGERVRFEELPAPPEMENLRSMLLSPPEFERPAVHYRHDERGADSRGFFPR